MANTFKNYTATDVGTSESTVYTVPASTTSILLGANLANTTGSMIYATVKMGGVSLITNAPVPSGSALSILDGKLIAEAGETVTVQSDTATSLDVILSVMEQS